MKISPLINSLRSRIDKRCNDIASYERLIAIRKTECYNVASYVSKRNALAKEQALDKRLLGTMIRLYESALFWNQKWADLYNATKEWRVEKYYANSD